MTAPDSSRDALASVLRERLACCRSATQELEAWCRAHGLPRADGVRVRRHPGPDAPPPAAMARLLGPRPGEPVRHRRVELVYGDVPLSQADNWYLPDRLDVSTRMRLETTDTPFGFAVAALGPKRRTLALRAPSALNGEWLFELDVLVTRHDGIPLAAIVERYRATLVDFARSEPATTES
ncbi:hypothetical protein NK718_08405 [Alsobacter sp. SYSU M60028]|uniref:SRPBCC family protein n=1 Tax=Alsobacter ponti TaxID=2962936 RepID=A0ABT1LBW4_9HYPH|nr:hypothetical protein [Alsobacter ponti]MCP8938533.1 hypothetical protein [Alsobacter ponti]